MELNGACINRNKILQIIVAIIPVTFHLSYTYKLFNLYFLFNDTLLTFSKDLHFYRNACTLIAFSVKIEFNLSAIKELVRQVLFKLNLMEFLV